MSRCDFAGLNAATSGLRYLRSWETFAWDDAITTIHNRTSLNLFILRYLASPEQMKSVLPFASRFRRQVWCVTKNLARQRRSAGRKNVLVEIARERVKDRLYGPWPIMRGKRCHRCYSFLLVEWINSLINASAALWLNNHSLLRYKGSDSVKARNKS